MVLLGLNMPSLESSARPLQLEGGISYIPGCSVPAPSAIWTVFVPSTVLHTVLFGFTVVRVVKVSQELRVEQLMRRLVRE